MKITKKTLQITKKLQQRRLGPFTVTKRITRTTYQIHDDKDPTVTKTVHRNHLVEYYPEEGSLAAMIEEYVPSDHQNDNFYERFMEQRNRDLNNPSTKTCPQISCPHYISCPQTSRNDLVCIVTILESLLHLPLLAPPCYHLQFLRKHQPPIRFLLSTHKLLNCRPGNFLVQFNNSFVTVPPTWLKLALNPALKRPNTIAHCPTIPIINQYCNETPGRAINFDPLYRRATLL